MQIQGPNDRESLVANGLLSRNRAVLVVLEQLYGSLEVLGQQEIDLVEALTGFALWLRRHVGGERQLRSELLEDAEQAFSDIPHQVLCSLTFSGASFDLVLSNELVEHVQELELAFGFPGGADASHRQLEAVGAGLGSARFEGWAGLQTLQMS